MSDSEALRAIVASVRAGESDSRIESVFGDAEGGVFRVTSGGRVLALKLAARDRESLSSLARECDAAQWAAEHGLGPAVLLASTDAGALVTEFLPGGSPSIESARTTDVLAKLGAFMRALHGAPRVPWRQDLRGDLHDEIDRAIPAFASDLRAALPTVLADVWAALDSHRAVLAPCHNDLHRGNVFVTERGVMAIDWAACAMGDPAWDVASFASSAELDDAGWQTLIASYEAACSRQIAARIRIYGLLADCYSLAWYVNDPSFDPGADARFATRVREAIRGDVLAEWLAVASGRRP